MQWHYGNIGSAIQGVGVIAVAVGALIKGPAVVRAWINGKNAEAEEARARAEALKAEAAEVALDRRRTLSGWSPHGVATYTTALVDEKAEMERAVEELTGRGPTAYVILRVDEGEGSANRGLELRRLVEERFVARPPTVAEREALETGLGALDVPSGYRREPPAALRVLHEARRPDGNGTLSRHVLELLGCGAQSVAEPVRRRVARPIEDRRVILVAATAHQGVHDPVRPSHGQPLLRLAADLPDAAAVHAADPATSDGVVPTGLAVLAAGRALAGLADAGQFGPPVSRCTRDGSVGSAKRGGSMGSLSQAGW